jgi:hypothetical protein
VCAALTGRPADAQWRLFGGRDECPPVCVQPCPTPAVRTPIAVSPTAPGQAPQVGTPQQPLTQQPLSQPPQTQDLASQTPAPDVGGGADQSAALGGESFAAALGNGGYLDNAVPRSQFRLRYDSAYSNNRPDRAEFFYAKCGCFRTGAFPLNDPNAAGPPLSETEVDFQEIHSYLEVAINHRLSAFVELPIRFLNPEINSNTTGLGDVGFGAKYALVACQDQYLTAQLRVWTPTGDSERGLGTNHVTLEPGLLYYRRLSDNLLFEAELRDWIAVDGSDYAGNVLRYGVGLSYDFYRSCGRKVTPVVELVGWTVLDGKSTDDLGFPQDAAGDTIVNAKLGVRFSVGDRGSLYVGYGRALTGEVWYKDMIRLEYRVAF